MRSSIGLLVSSIISVAMVSGCSAAAPSAEGARKTASADTSSDLPTGFRAFGGNTSDSYNNWCLATVGAGAQGVGVTTAACSLVGQTQGFSYTNKNQIVLTDSTEFCLDVDNGEPNPTTHVGGVHLQYCTANNAAQKWFYVSGQLVSGVAPASNGKSYCLDVYGATGGNPVDVAECNDTIAQVWWPNGFRASLQSDLCTAGPGVPCLTEAASLCADVVGDSSARGASVHTNGCTADTDGETFTFFNGNIMNHYNCLAVTSYSQSIGTLQMEQCDGSGPQTWYFDLTSRGVLELQNRDLAPTGASQCLDVYGASTAVNATVDTYTCGTTNTAQIWNAVLVPNVTD